MCNSRHEAIPTERARVSLRLFRDKFTRDYYQVSLLPRDLGTFYFFFMNYDVDLRRSYEGLSGIYNLYNGMYSYTPYCLACIRLPLYVLDTLRHCR